MRAGTEQIMKKTLMAIVVLAAALPLAANEFDLPPGKWWENQRLVDYVGITAEQQATIGDLVYEHARRMIDLKADVEKAGLDLANVVSTEEFDEPAVRSSYGAFQAARHKLENERFEMLVAVRKVLTAEQWQKMQDLRKRIQQNRGQQRRPGQRPQGGQRPMGEGPPAGLSR